MLKRISDLPKYFNAETVKKRLVVAPAQELTVLQAALKAAQLNYVELILIGDSKLITELAESSNLDLNGISILQEQDAAKSVALAVKMVFDGKADLILKGQISTSILLKYVYQKEFGIKKSEVMSHLGLFELPDQPKLLALTDAVINIAPDLKTKTRIIENGVVFIRKLGVETPLVAALGAVEMINPSMVATTDAGLLSRMSQIGQLANCSVEGPLTFDRAINQHQADLLLAPDIEAASMLYRSLLYFGKAKSASVLLGAKVPLIISTMSDSEETIFNSILLSALID